MTRVIVFVLVVAGIAAVLLFQLQTTAELVAWEVLLLLVLIVLVRLFPRAGREPAPPLFGSRRRETPRPPRSVSSYELAAVHAFSESPGADRRLRGFMRRIAGHRLRQKGIVPGGARSDELIDAALFVDSLEPMSASRINKIVDQLEKL